MKKIVFKYTHLDRIDTAPGTSIGTQVITYKLNSLKELNFNIFQIIYNIKINLMIKM